MFPTRGLGCQCPALEVQALLSTAMAIVPTSVCPHGYFTLILASVLTLDHSKAVLFLAVVSQAESLSLAPNCGIPGNAP